MSTWPIPAGAKNPMRFERKFASDEDRRYVESTIRFHPALFTEIHHRRWVNNIYLDTWALDSCEDNLAGESRQRVKVRIRWYGELWGRVEQPVLELKRKQNLVNWKEQFPLRPVTMGASLSTRSLRDVFRTSDLPEALTHDLLKLEPTLVNRYSRTYFRTPDHAYRITIDSDLIFFAISASRRPAPDRYYAADTVILELKYDLDAAVNAERITQSLPFRLTRNSKYVFGLELIRYPFEQGRGGPRIGMHSR